MQIQGLPLRRRNRLVLERVIPVGRARRGTRRSALTSEQPWHHPDVHAFAEEEGQAEVQIVVRRAGATGTSQIVKRRVAGCKQRIRIRDAERYRS